MYQEVRVTLISSQNETFLPKTLTSCADFHNNKKSKIDLLTFKGGRGHYLLNSKQD